jgi:hypothetical protein
MGFRQRGAYLLGNQGADEVVFEVCCSLVNKLVEVFQQVANVSISLHARAVEDRPRTDSHPAPQPQSSYHCYERHSSWSDTRYLRLGFRGCGR